MTDVDHARMVVQRSMCPHDLEIVRRDGHLDAWMWSHRLYNLSFNDIAYGDDVGIVPGCMESFFVAMIPLSGSSVIRCGNQEAFTDPQTAAVPNPDEWLAMRWTRTCAQRVTRFERPAMHAVLAGMLGHPLHRGPLKFDLAVDLRTGHGLAFAQDIHRVAYRLEHTPQLYAHRFVVDAVEEELISRLLLAAHHNYRDDLHTEPAPGPSRTVHTVLELMHQDASRRHTLTSLANAAKTSTRTLERKFQARFGMGPVAYYRGVRLDRVRQKLLAADPDTTTIAEIAASEGFPNGGRCAGWYRARFGESPSETFQR